MEASARLHTDHFPMPGRTKPEMLPFKHEPLDLNEPSIRLLRFIEDFRTDASTIRCAMYHTSIMAAPRYICLSYRWGNDDPENRILLEGKELYVRKNLFDFLEVASKRKEQKDDFERGTLEVWYWIDALCIDQDNTIEKNHQVQQMGDVYRHAERVFIWLGKSTDLSTLSEYLNPPKDMPTWSATMEKRDRMRDYLYSNKYWSRAWITQEIVLAQSIVVLANDEEMDFEMLRQDISKRQYDYMYRNAPVLPFTTDIAHNTGKSLIQLLVKFKGRRCHIPHDQIYSLLSICGRGKKLRVDYSMPVEELMVQVLRHCRSQLCLCSAAVVASSLDLHTTIPTSDSKAEDDLSPATQEYWIEFDVQAHTFSQGPWHVLQSDTWDAIWKTKHSIGVHQPHKQGPNVVFNALWSCPVDRRFALYWRQPSTARGKQPVWQQPSIPGDTNSIIYLCDYGEGFEVRRHDGSPYVYEATNADSGSVDLPEGNPFETTASTFSTLDRNPYIKNIYNVASTEAKETFKVRLSFRNLARLMGDDIKFCNLQRTLSDLRSSYEKGSTFRGLRIEAGGKTVLRSY